MNEGFPHDPTESTSEELERQKKEKQEEDRNTLATLLKEHGQEEQLEIVVSRLEKYEQPEEPAPKRETAPEVEEFKRMIADFEANHPLEELHAITELTKEQIENHPLRTPAKKALNPILALLNNLQGAGEYDALKADYKRLSRAVGMVNNGKVDHER